MGLFTSLFGKSKRITKNSFVDMFSPYFGNFGSDITRSNVVMEAVNSITKHGSKLKLQHYIGDKRSEGTSSRKSLEYLFNYAPNSIENGADFLEKAMYHWLVSNNCFIFLKFEPSHAGVGKEILESMWVIDTYNTKVHVDSAGEIYLTFYINNELEKVTTHIDNVVVIKRLVGNDEFFGSSNDAIRKVLSIIDTNYQGIENAIKSSAFIRFIVESVTVLAPDKRKKKAQEFSEEYLAAASNGGVIFTDSTGKVTPIKNEPIYSNVKELDAFYKAVYNYFGTNEKIVQGTYTDSEWNSFFESTIEVFVNRLELEFTKKLFTPKEYEQGNRIVVEVDKLQKMSIQARLNIINAVKELGLLTINEMRSLVYLPPVADGDKREVSLNYVDADKQNQYQVGEKDKDKDKEKEETENEE